jgi:hypothetical protein
LSGKKNNALEIKKQSEKIPIKTISFNNSWALGILELKKENNILKADTVKNIPNVTDINSVQKSLGWSNSNSVLKDINERQKVTTDLKGVLPKFKSSSKADLKSSDVGQLSNSTNTETVKKVLPVKSSISIVKILKSAAVGGLSESSSLVNIGNNPANVSFSLNHKFV